MSKAIFETARGGVFTCELDVPVEHVPPAYEIEGKTFALTMTPIFERFEQCPVRGYTEPLLYVEEHFGLSILDPDD